MAGVNKEICQPIYMVTKRDPEDKCQIEELQNIINSFTEVRRLQLALKVKRGIKKD